MRLGGQSRDGTTMDSGFSSTWERHSAAACLRAHLCLLCWGLFVLCLLLVTPSGILLFRR